MISTDKARCEKCKKVVMTIYGGDKLWLCEKCLELETKIKEGEYIGI